MTRSSTRATIMITALPDGLYRVVTSYLCAGFVVERGKVTRCAPILRAKLAYWALLAKLVP